jgi:hypothetical protein
MKRNSRAGRLCIRSGSPDKGKLELNIENGYYYQLSRSPVPASDAGWPENQGARS